MQTVAGTQTEATKRERVIVSLTTYPGRIDRVHMAIESLLRQTVAADMVVLWLASEQFPCGEAELPAPLLAQKERGLSIEWCEDIKSYKKLIPAVERYPEDIIITADDDIIYRADAIELLLRCHERCPGSVCALRTHLMTFGADGSLAPYNDWKPEYSAFVCEPHMALFPTTGAGTLFPPGILPPETFEREVFMSLCPKADDVFTKIMLTLAGVPVALAAVNTRLQYVEGTQQESLWGYNLDQNGNDVQLAAVLERYNIPVEQLDPGDTLVSRMNDLPEHQPKDEFCQKFRRGRSYVNERLGARVSIIIAARNAENAIKRCVRSALAQSMTDIEIICVSDGSTDGTAGAMTALSELDERVRTIIIDEREGLCAARRRAVLESRGEYILFPGVHGVLAPDACERLYASAEENDADILAFTRGILRKSRDGAQADPVFSGCEGRLRARAIIEREYGIETSRRDCLCDKLLSGRLCRKAYMFLTCQPLDSEEYDYFLLAWNAEMYFGEQTPVSFASPESRAPEPRECAATIAAIRDYCFFARKQKENASLCEGIEVDLLDGGFTRMNELPLSERPMAFERLSSAWNSSRAAVGLWRLCGRAGVGVLEIAMQTGALSCAPRPIGKLGIVTQGGVCARELFNMTEVMNVVSREGRDVALIGLNRETAAATVLTAKARCVGEELNAADAPNEMQCAAIFDRLLTENGFDMVIISASDPRFTRLSLQCRLRGVLVAAVVTEPVGAEMLDCSPCALSPSQLALAAVTVTDSRRQEHLLMTMGIRGRYIPRPALKLMGGRSNSRASADAIVWAGEPDDSRSRIGEALRIFGMVAAARPETRMLMYVDCSSARLEQLAADMPDGVQLRRLRPDYGIFDDACAHLMTVAAAINPSQLRAARTLGIPTVMYDLGGETDTAGTIAVAPGDAASAAGELLSLFADRNAREQLSAEARREAEKHGSELAAQMWTDALEAAADDVDGRFIPVGEQEAEMCAMLTAVAGYYDSGSVRNAARLREYDRRCEEYERRLNQSEQESLRQTAELQKKLEEANRRLSEAAGSSRRLESELNDTRASTAYRVGRLLTHIPRKAKGFISRLRGGK